MIVEETASQNVASDFGEGCALVVGGGGILGTGICHAFARSGVPVALTYFSNQASADAVQAEVERQGVEASSSRLDLRDSDEIQQVLADAHAHFGRIHTVVYSAGPKFTPEFFSRTPVTTWRDWLDTDVLGCIQLAQASLPYLRDSHGSLVTLSTYQNDRIAVRGSPSSIAKAALDRMVVAIAKEEGKYGVRANSVRAGWIGEKAQRMLEQVPEIAQTKLKDIPLGRLGYTEEIADTVVFLASRRAGYITGVNLTVDGGVTL